MESKKPRARTHKCSPRGGRIGKIDAGRVWAEIEEHFVPNLRVWLSERVLYFYLLRKTRLAGKRAVLTSIGQLARDLCLSKNAARTALWELSRKRAVRILARNREGHHVEVRTPREIPGCVVKAGRPEKKGSVLENCARSRTGRRAIFEREGHRCFYCLRLLGMRARVLDHVRPRTRGGRGSYRNVVGCCAACNALKGDMPAEDFLRRLHRQGLISRREFYRRMEALEALKRGRLRPKLPKAA